MTGMFQATCAEPAFLQFDARFRSTNDSLLKAILNCT